MKPNDRHMYRLSIHGNGNSEPCSDHSLTKHDKLQHSSIQLYANRNDSFRHNLFMEYTGSRCRRDRRRISIKPEHAERHPGQHHIRGTDSHLHDNTNIRQLYRLSIHGHSISEPKSDDHSAEHKHLYNGSIQL